MTTPRRTGVSRPHWAALVFTLCLIAAGCGGSDGAASTTTEPPSTEPDGTETTLSSGAQSTTTGGQAGAETEQSTTDGTANDAIDDGDAVDGVDPEDPGEQPPEDEPWRASPVADAVLTPAELGDALGGTWVLDSGSLTTPAEATGTTCDAPDPATFDGIEALYFAEGSELEFGQIIQTGSGVDVWVDAFERLATCDEEFFVTLVDLPVSGADDSAIIDSAGEGTDGYVSGGGARRGDVFVGYVAFADDPDDLPPPATIVALLESSLGEAVVLAQTSPIGTTPVMALSDADLESAGLGGGFELIRLDEAPADPVADEWNGEPCTLPSSDAFDGFDLELVGPFGDPRIVQIVSTGPDVGQWTEALAGLNGCADSGGPPMVRADVWVEGANDAVVLGADGVDAEGTSYAAAAGVAGDTAVVVLVFADSPDDPALDVRIVADLASIALANR